MVYMSRIKIIKFISFVLKSANPYLIKITKIIWGMGTSIFEVGY